MVKYNKSGALSEYQVQKTIVQWLQAHNIVHMSIPNEAANNPIKGKHLKATGLHKGASDLFIAHACHNFHGMFLEVKTTTGVLRPEQMNFFRLVEKNNYFTSACWTIDEGLSILKWYLGK